MILKGYRSGIYILNPNTPPSLLPNVNETSLFYNGSLVQMIQIVSREPQGVYVRTYSLFKGGDEEFKQFYKLEVKLANREAKEVGLRISRISDPQAIFTFYQDDSMRLNKRPGLSKGTSNPGNENE